MTSRNFKRPCRLGEVKCSRGFQGRNDEDDVEDPCAAAAVSARVKTKEIQVDGHATGRDFRGPLLTPPRAPAHRRTG